MLDATSWKAKYLQNAGSASAAYVAGTKNPKRDPLQAAIENRAAMRANVIAAIDDGRWEAGLNAVTLGEWQAACEKKGAPNYLIGIDAGKGKYNSFVDVFRNDLISMQSAVLSMPGTTLPDRIARSAAMINKLHDWGEARR